MGINLLYGKKECVINFVDTNYIESIFLYILVYIATVISSLPLTALLTILSGFLYGVLPGSIFSMIGAILGATLSLFLFKYFLGDQFQVYYAKRLNKFNENFEKYGAQYLILIHLFMVVPFFVINALSSMTRVSHWTFIWTTFIGMLPSTFLYTYAGHQLRIAKVSGNLFSWKVILIFSVMILMGLASILFKRYKEKKKI
jgi:uncharacterized membrane protein YdjX (TVP38/TMEM64 family)